MCIICSIYSAVLILIIAILFFVIIPVVFMFSTGIQKSLVFPTYLIEPKNYSNTELYDIHGVRNFYIDIPSSNNEETTENITIGMWQILPQEILSEFIKNEEYNFDGILTNEKYNILLYLHGNGSDRTNSIELYKILRRFFQIFAVDYRGYGDSNGYNNLTETNIVKDLEFIYKWLKNRTKSKIFLWGHSLGTGIATHLLSSLKKENISATGLILETPFTSVVDVMREHPIIKFYSFLPWRDATILDPMIKHDFNFDSKIYITDIDCPIMILHAKDDDVIPYEIATSLYYIATNHRNLTYQGNVIYNLYEKHGFGHMLLHLEAELPKQVFEFINICLKFQKN